MTGTERESTPGRREWRDARRYLDLVQVLVVALDREGGIKLVNRKACEVLGRDKGELVGKDWFATCLPERDRERFREVFRGLMAGEVEEIEYYENPVLTAGGEERMIGWRNTVLTNARGEASGTLSSGEGLTEQILAAEALCASEARNAAILEAAVEGIITASERGIIDSFNPAACRIFGYAAEEVIGRNLSVLMPETRMLRIAEIARHVASGTRRDEMFEGVRFSFAGDGTLEARVDPQLMEQVFWNLFLNAAQAMETGGHIRISFHGAEGILRVTVEDDGPGIPAEVEGRIFLPFATTKARGTGLGLAICRRILEAHGGAIEVESEPGEGARIHLDFPTGEGE